MSNKEKFSKMKRPESVGYFRKDFKFDEDFKPSSRSARPIICDNPLMRIDPKFDNTLDELADGNQLLEDLRKANYHAAGVDDLMRVGSKYGFTNDEPLVIIDFGKNGEKTQYIKLKRIIARRDVFDYRDRTIAKKGELGGWIQTSDNLDLHDGSWVEKNAIVYGDTKICFDSIVKGKAIVGGNVYVCNSIISDNALVHGDGISITDSRVKGNAQVMSECNIEESCVGDNVSLENATVLFVKDLSFTSPRKIKDTTVEQNKTLHKLDYTSYDM